MKNICVISNGTGFKGSFSSQLTHSAFITKIVFDPSKALLMLNHDNRIMAIIGTVLSGVDGVEIYKKIHRIYNVAILLLTRNNNEEIGRLLRFKADRFELKLFGYPLLEAHVEAILR